MKRALEWLCLALVVQGLSWIVLLSFDPFGVWEGLAAQALYGSESLPQAALPLARLLTAILGATDAGFFVLMFVLVRHGFGEHTWAYRGVVAGVLTWGLVDSAASAALGAWFNVALVNLPALVLLGVPLWIVRPSGRSWAALSDPRGRHPVDPEGSEQEPNG